MLLTASSGVHISPPFGFHWFAVNIHQVSMDHKDSAGQEVTISYLP